MAECVKCLFNSENYTSIKLNEEGVCDICLINEKRIKAARDFRSSGKPESALDEIKKNKIGKYHCIIGISGGADSTYMVYLAKKWGLNPLLFHVDGGWNSEISVSNIRKIVEKSGFDYIAEVLPWNEMRDIQRSFIRAGVIDIDLPFDNLMLSYNHRLAKKHKIKHIFFGTSSDTEGIMPAEYTHYKLDKKNIYDIHKRWGTTSIKNLNFLGTSEFMWFSKIQKIKMSFPLDWIVYNKEEVKEIVKREFDWVDYGWKHNESVYTRFYQNHILPKKFKVDKRVSHLSMLICSDQLTKQQAKEILVNSPIYSSAEEEQKDKDFFIKKLNLTPAEFDEYISSAPVSHRAYKSELDRYDSFRKTYRFIKKRLGIKAFAG